MRTVTILVSFFLLSPSVSPSQELVISSPSSPESNALGGVYASSLTEHPMGMVENPAILGFSGGSGFVSSSILLPEIEDRPAWWGSSHRTEFALLVGFHLDTIPFLPGQLNLGLGYSRRTDDIPCFWDMINAPEYYPGSPGRIERGHISLGFQHHWRVAAGISLKWWSEPPMGKGFIYDVAVGTVIPVLRLLSVPSDESLRSDIDVSMGVLWADLGSGGKDIFGESPRKVVGNVGIRFRLNVPRERDEWEVLTLAIIREAEDDLRRRYPWSDSLGGPRVEYLGGLGKIQIFKNLFLGQWSGDGHIRFGVEAGLLDLIFFRWGNTTSSMKNNQTGGLGINSRGLLNVIDVLIGLGDQSVYDVLANSVEVRYDFTLPDCCQSGERLMKYSSLSLTWMNILD